MFNPFALITRIYPNIDSMPALDAAAAAERGEIVLIDVRSHDEIAATGKARGALHIELPYIRHKANRSSPHFDAALDPAKTFALYCDNGTRSLLAARIMKKLGYENVYNMGAFREWQNGKLPVDR
ncbi:rhodanese-like domain-containing protein [Rhodovulum euryhalinum]|uniref:Rhodanese-related sulfurtransferase n=1 Tax=Rhodovulum euryhalinum TaxID=35805 RepID=A0A4R2KCF1_9RHOB|nr:rhodanese-like domain-containing protein [Rhodovulum euryhalinum]TCO70564.1 rhodanese-related sulfurtransferase [Rhodovulum euryhalinum]